MVDLRRLDFLDLRGLHVLIAADRRARGSGGRMLVVRAAEMVVWFMTLVGAGVFSRGW